MKETYVFLYCNTGLLFYRLSRTVYIKLYSQEVETLLRNCNSNHFSKVLVTFANFCLITLFLRPRYYIFFSLGFDRPPPLYKIRIQKRIASPESKNPSPLLHQNCYFTVGGNCKIYACFLLFFTN